LQIANALLSLAGDPGNTVPKYNVTVAEITVLRQIHGESAVNEIEPVGEIERSDREELERLHEMFPRPAGTPSPVRAIYPGAVARVHHTFAEVDIPDTCFKATARVSRETPLAQPAGKAPRAAKAPRGAKAPAGDKGAGEASTDGSDLLS
jgi:hypothetical protein